MPMVTKPFRVVAYHERLPPTNSHESYGLARSRDKLNSL